jgi:hypothetical protein
MLLFIVANILGSSVQITTLPLVILSPLQASGLVFNSICATLILSEPFTRYSLIGTILVSIGAALIAVFGALEEPAHSLDELLELFVRKIFILWMILQLILVTGILIGAKASRILWPRHKNTVRMKMFRGISYGAVRYDIPPYFRPMVKPEPEATKADIPIKWNPLSRLSPPRQIRLRTTC